jgi:hypothetical protein
MTADATFQKLISARHPMYLRDFGNWQLWRNTYDSGEYFVQHYLQKFTTRESDEAFQSRKSITPIPAFAKAAINDVRNSIFQRLRDALRKNGSTAYKNAIQGLHGGVDMHGSSMDKFMGVDLLTELLVMGRVGCYVDMPIASSKFSAIASLADTMEQRPYLYMYPVEDILSWTCSNPSQPEEFQAILLRDRCTTFKRPGQYQIEIPDGHYERFRLVWINQDTGRVNVQFFNDQGLPVNSDGLPTAEEPIELELTSIPFCLLDIGDSLLKDVSRHQIALLNLGSSDVAYALKANFPFYVEQRDLRAVGDHLKNAANPDGTATSGGQGAKGTEIEVGATQGRAYDLKMNEPSFIHPSPEPLEASIKLQEKLEDDIRKLVQLAIQNKIGKRVSPESKQMDNQGLEAGLSFIGLILEGAERRIAEFWGAYEERLSSLRQVATIKYPDRYSLKTDRDRIEEASKVADLMFTVPGRTVKQELAKDIVATLLSGKATVATLDRIFREIEAADYTTSDPEVIIRAKEAGLVGEKTASVALGFRSTEYIQAREDHMERIARIKEAQSEGAEELAGARGVDDLSSSPNEDGKVEKEESRETAQRESVNKPVRGDGRDIKSLEE